MAIPWGTILALIGVFGVSFLGGYFLPQVYAGMTSITMMFMQIMMMIMMFSMIKALW